MESSSRIVSQEGHLLFQDQQKRAQYLAISNWLTTGLTTKKNHLYLCDITVCKMLHIY